jgi:hypothetical protein
MAEIYDYCSSDYFVGQQSNHVSWVNYGYLGPSGWHTGLLNPVATRPTERKNDISSGGSSGWTTWDDMVP